MNRRIKTIIIVELLIIVGLIVHLVRSPRFLVLFAFAVFFTFLAKHIRIFRAICAVFWVITVGVFLTAGWFWLALLFPVITAIIFWKRGIIFHEKPNENPAESETINRTNGNDIIDLYDIDFRPEGNSLSIKKAAGNTKIIVPDDVAIALDITVNSGIVKIFEEQTKINPYNLRYFSENSDFANKRIRIQLQVQTGNVEVVKG